MLEVAIAMAILVMALAALLGHEGVAIQMSDYSNKMSQAVFLAQGKLLDLEYKLIKDGMDQFDNCEQGDFREEGFRGFEWKVCAYKLEIAEGAADQMAEQFVQMLTGGLDPNMMAGLTQDPAKAAILDQAVHTLMSAIPMFLQQLEDKIRKVRLEVTWKDAVGDRQFVLERFVTTLGEDRSGDQAATTGLPDGGLVGQRDAI